MPWREYKYTEMCHVTATVRSHLYQDCVDRVDLKKENVLNFSGGYNANYHSICKLQALPKAQRSQGLIIITKSISSLKTSQSCQYVGRVNIWNRF